MDPLAHTLVGATLAETGLRRASPLATLTLVVGANLPDIDAIAMLAGQDTALLLRRGWTHGVVGLAVLPFLWIGVVATADRLVRRRRHPDAVPCRLGVLLGLTILAILTHPFLDWLNTYGVRLLTPFDTSWFYGDALFIVDPWIWLMLASAVVLARSRGTLGISAWAIVGIAATALVVGVDRTPLVAKIAWMVGLALIVAARATRVATHNISRVASVTLVGAASYVGGMLVGNRIAHEQVNDWMVSEGLEAEVLMVGPLPARPLARDVIARSGTHYHFIEVDWSRSERFTFSHRPVALGSRDDPAVQAALRSKSIRGLRAWLRFPAYEVETTSHGHRVTIRDVRYARPDTERATPLGKVVVDLDFDLRLR
jgi:inner membrane protein